MKRLVAAVMLLLTAGFAGWAGLERERDAQAPEARRGRGERVVPVEVAAVTRGPIEQRREFTGTLSAFSEFVVAPKVSGRVERLDVDLADTVSRGQLVGKLDDDEYVQAVAQVRADHAVAEANLAEATAQLTIADRELQRVQRLRSRGVTSESELDTARAEQLAREAHVQVTRAQLARTDAELEAARIRLGYTEVRADWSGGGDRRVVAERYVDEGETVSANAPLLRIVELDPLTAVLFVTERDYGLLAAGMSADLETDAYPGERFRGEITRIAPVFRENTRQARVELRVANPDGRLKPGLFVRITVVLDRVESAIVVPEQALVRRESGTGVFMLDAARTSVAWTAVRTGIRDRAVVQILEPALEGEVVVLGQQLLEDGARVVVGGVGGGG